VKWPSIKVNVWFSLINSIKVSLSVSNIVLRSCCFQPIATVPGFRSVADPHSSTCLHIAFTEQTFQTFSRNYAAIVWYPKQCFRNVSIRALSSYDILPITKVIGLTAIMTWNIERYVARKHKNDVTTKIVLVAQ